MTRVRHRSSIRPMRWPFRLAMAMLAVVQLGTVGLAVAASAVEGRGAGVHVEAPGLPRHYAHDERSCIVCITHAPGGIVGQAQRNPAPAVRAAEPVPATATHPAGPHRRWSSAPRAPPASH